MYSMMESGQISGGVDALPPNRRFSVFKRGSALIFHAHKFDLGDNDLFFLYLFCTYFPAHELALSKESIESNHVNTPSKSGLRSHSCTYFLGLFLQKIGTSSAETARKVQRINISFTLSDSLANEQGVIKGMRASTESYTPFAPMML